LSEADTNEKKKDNTDAGGDLPGSPSGYSFFVNEPGNAAYTFGMDTSPPDWFHTMTSGISVSAPAQTSAPAQAAGTAPTAPVPPSSGQNENQANIAQDVMFSQGVTISQNAAPTQEAKVFENTFDWQHTSVAENATYSAMAHVTQDAFNSPHTSVSQNASYSQQASVAQDAFATQQSSVQASVAQNAFSLEDASVSQDAFKMPEAAPLAQTVNSGSTAKSAPDLRDWGVVPPAEPVYDANHSDAEGWPKPRGAKRPSEVTTAPLHLSADKRFAKLALTPELTATIDRIYTLVDLDFNGYVDFFELSSVLESDHLSESEKGFVRLIYAVGCKVLAERPALSDGTVPALTKQDFTLAFAFQVASTMGNTEAISKGILQSGQSTKTGQFTEFKPTLYADLDYPLVSIKPAAVRLGTMGDAYFAAGVGSLAETRPRAMMRIICENLDHSFSISFPGAQGKPLEVMPPRPEEMLRYALAAKYGFWFPLLEKANGIYMAQTNRLGAKLVDQRNESFSRAAQVIETLTGATTGTLVTADCLPADLLRKIADLTGKKQLVIAVSSDFVPDASAFVGTSPIANKPYPLTGIDVQRGQVFLASVYGQTQSALGDEPMQFSTEQFLRFFKVVYYEEDSESGSKVSHLMRTKKKTSAGGNPWKNA